MQHSFDVDEAILYGIEKAVLLNNMRFWLEKNAANSKHVADGYVWTYNSAAAYESLFPYMKAKTIGRYMREMEEDGLLISSQQNKNKLDRTKFYSMPEYSVKALLMRGYPIAQDVPTIAQNETVDCPKVSNVTDINNTDINNKYIKDLNTSCRNSKVSTTKPKQSKFVFTEDDKKLAEWMFSRVQIINPTAKQPNIDSWSNDIRMIRLLDHHSLKEISALFDWANRDSFWCVNILSPKKLRAKWDQLAAKAINPQRQATVAGNSQNLSADCTEAFRMIQNGEIF